MASRVTSWLSVVLGANPHHNVEANEQVEYQFTSARGGRPQTHEGGQRVFRGQYKRRGPYEPPVLADGAMTWNGQPITFRGQQLTWGDDSSEGGGT